MNNRETYKSMTDNELNKEQDELYALYSKLNRESSEVFSNLLACKREIDDRSLTKDQKCVVCGHRGYRHWPQWPIPNYKTYCGDHKPSHWWDIKSQKYPV